VGGEQRVKEEGALEQGNRVRPCGMLWEQAEDEPEGAAQRVSQRRGLRTSLTRRSGVRASRGGAALRQAQGPGGW
jgi:hypothetical protein